MVKKEIGLVYLCIWNRAKERSIEGELMIKEFCMILNKIYCIPKRFVYPIIKEMENKGLIKWDNKRVIKIIDVGFDFENTSKIYQGLGFF